MILVTFCPVLWKSAVLLHLQLLRRGVILENSDHPRKNAKASQYSCDLNHEDRALPGVLHAPLQKITSHSPAGFDLAFLNTDQYRNRTRISIETEYPIPMAVVIIFFTHFNI